MPGQGNGDPFGRCRAATGVRSACEALCDDLVELGVELPSVYLLVGGRLRCQGARGYFQVVDGFPPGTGVIGRTVATGTSQVVDATTESAFIAAIPGIVSKVCVPVLLGGTVVGAVNAESTTGAAPPEWLALLTAAAAVLGERLAAAGGLPPDSLTQRVARHAVELGELSELPEIERWSAAAAARLADMSTAAVVRRDPSRLLTVSTAAGSLAEPIRRWSVENLRLIASWLRAGTSAYIPRADVGPAYAFLAEAGVRSLFAHPLVARGATVGLLLVADERPVGHDPEVVEALELLAALTASALMTAMAMDALRRQATRDPLTGLGNSAAFASALAGTAGAAPRDRSVACMIVDIDHFKAINDTQGHLAGDEALRAVAAALSGALRSHDELYRIGGDEFAVVTLVRGARDADLLAARLLRAARSARLTVSVGYAVGQDGDVDELRARADAALYAAKDAGRNTARRAP